MRLLYLALVCSLLLSGCSSGDRSNIVSNSTKNDDTNEVNKKSSLTAIPLSPKSNSEQTSTFTIKETLKDVIMFHKIRGENRKFGFLDKPLVIKEENKLEWLFWPMNNQQPTGELKIRGIHLESGKEILAKGQITPKKSPIKELPKEHKPIPLTTNKTQINENKIHPVSRGITSIKFPQPGTWELKLIINDKLAGNMKVNVRSNESNTYYLNNS